MKLVSQKSPFGQAQSAFVALEARVLDAAEALSSNVKFQTWREGAFYGLGVYPDFEEPKPQTEKCRLLYMGQEYRSSSVHIFLAVERTELDKYRRIGHAMISDVHDPIWKNRLDSAQREVIVIE